MRRPWASSAARAGTAAACAAALLALAVPAHARPAPVAVAARPAPAVAAAPASAMVLAQEGELGLAAEADFGGPAADPGWTPVEVTLEPLRPVAGTIEVQVDLPSGGAVRFRRDVEVAATSRAVYRMVVPTGRVAVRFAEAGREPVAVPVEQGLAGSGFLVGLLGGAVDQAPPVRDEPAGRTGTWVAVDAGWLDVSPAALAPLGTLVARADALADLAPGAAANLAAAVAGGTDLVVVADRDGPVDLAALGLTGLPGVTAGPGGTLQADGAAWTATPAQLGAGPGGEVVAVAAPAGRGRVAVTSAVPGEGELGTSGALWSQLAGPGLEQRGTDWAVTQQPYQLARVLADGEGGVPSVPWLAAFLVGYVVVVGPVNGVVLARLRRRELAWVTVPVVTAVFTAAAFLGAVGGRPDLGVNGRLVWWLDGAGVETTVAGLRRSTPGEVEARVPAGAVRLLADGARGGSVEIGEDLRVAAELPALQLGGVLASRAATAPPPLEVRADVRGDRVAVAVRNTGTTPLRAVTVRGATVSVGIGDLDPGAGDTVELRAARLQTTEPYRDLLIGIPRGGAGSFEALLRADLVDLSPGVVWAVAAQDAPGEDGTGDRGTLWAVGARPAVDPARGVPALAVDRTMVAVGADTYAPTPLAVEGSGEVVLRFRVPPGGRLDRLVGDLERSSGGAADLTVWDVPARQWVRADEALPGGDGDPARLVSPLGEVHVRASGNLSPFDFSGRSVGSLPLEGSS